MRTRESPVLYGLGNGQFESRVTSPVRSGGYGVEAVDLNGDRRLELVLVNRIGSTLSLFRVLENGALDPAGEFAADPSPREVAIADLNGDGRSEVLLSSFSTGNVSVLDPADAAPIPRRLTAGNEVARRR